MGRDEKCVNEQGAAGRLGALSKSLPGPCKPDPIVLVSKSSRAPHPPSSFHFPTEKAKTSSSMWEGVSLIYPCTLSSFMAPTGSKRRLYLAVGVQHPSFLLFHVNEESKSGIIIYGRRMGHLTVLINIPNYFIFRTKHTFCLLIRSFIITIFLFWTALLLWIIWGGVIFFCPVCSEISVYLYESFLRISRQ